MFRVANGNLNVASYCTEMVRRSFADRTGGQNMYLISTPHTKPLMTSANTVWNFE